MKYLFGCTYNGETYQQTQEDVSLTNPEKSSFYDVMDKDIEKFWLNDGENNYLVDLRDGSFEVNGRKFLMHDEELSAFRIIYYRKRSMSFIGTETVDDSTQFCLGWQTTNNGENIKRIMTIL